MDAKTTSPLYVPAAHAAHPRRYWVLIAFLIAVVVLEDFQPRLTPSGWPTAFDYGLMLLLPIGAIVMALATSMPGWLLGLYGLFGACAFLVAQFNDTRLPLRLDSARAINILATNWCAFVVFSWAVCRAAVLLRKLWSRFVAIRNHNVAIDATP